MGEGVIAGFPALKPPGLALPLGPGGLAPVARWTPRAAVSPGALALARSVAEAGGRALVVGGWVRDGLLGAAPKDEDVEVFGLTPEAVAALSVRGVKPVGAGFGILKVGSLDVSFPRRRRARDVGTEAWVEDVAPELSLVEAARRRDLTINAMAWDPLSCALYDPHGGLRDLAGGCLRWVDPETFPEDPLRILRVIQLMARLDFTVAPALATAIPPLVGPMLACPRERIWEEIENLLVKGKRFDGAFALARETGILGALIPPVAALPPGEMSTLLRSLAHRAHSHDPLGVDGRTVALALLLWPLPEDARVPMLEAWTAERRVLVWAPRAAEEAPKIEALAQALARGEDVAPRLRRLARRAPIPLLLRIHGCRVAGETGADDPRLLPLFEAMAAAGVAEGPLEPLVKGRDLLRAGIRPGPDLGRLLEAVYEAQMDGLVTTKAQGTALAGMLSGEG